MKKNNQLEDISVKMYVCLVNLGAGFSWVGFSYKCIILGFLCGLCIQISILLLVYPKLVIPDIY